MIKRRIIDKNQPWLMRVSTPGKDVETGGPPYAFDGSLETLQVHQSGILTSVFNIRSINTPQVYRTIGPVGDSAPDEIIVSFPALAYIPQIEWFITSASTGSSVNYPGGQTNTVGGTLDYDIVELPVTVIPATSSFKIIATTADAATRYTLGNGNSARQGDFYYTVFKRPTT